MARSTAKTVDPTLNSPTQPSTPLPSEGSPRVSLAGPPADVPQYGPTEDIVISVVPERPQVAPEPKPDVVYGDDGSITIK